ncbi:heme biosynthesis protein HemY [Rhizobium sp. C4]|uniref:heme biosynthesis protein HemY n=1 Tax=Rhizobium sp. C4 TaxID=1349800 RepID=UPI001E48EC26|nr:heme biosynthesis protein HemY [Rhizobium sp. C4]MCD2175486.1 heme biosynthesis protein HemY [Rhizobium sp. C4]
MIKLLGFVLVVLALAWGFAWLADRPGDITIVWQGQQIEMSVMVAVTLIVALIAVIMFIWWVIRTVWTSPRSINRYFRARKRDRGYQALSTGLIAASAGDAATARKMNARAKGLLSADQEPLIHLLEAQANLIEGRNDEARRKFEQMAEDPETRELGLRGLYLEAKRLGADEAANQYAERAVEKAPHLPWAAEATLEAKMRLGLFDDSLKLLEQYRLSGAIGKDEANRKKAVLMTAKAAAALDGNPKVAGDDAQHALRLEPSLIPAGIVAAKALYREGNLRKASAVLERLWKAAPHPDIAASYIHAQGNLTSDERLRRAIKLETAQPEAYEALYASAAAAFDMRDFRTAREKAEAAAKLDMRESVFLLLADIEEEETGDQARIRHWMSMARRAPQDPAWLADGFVSQVWLPLSPVTGRIDAFEWRKLERQAGTAIEHEPLTAETAFLSLPPVNAPRPATPSPDVRIVEEQASVPAKAEPAPAAKPAAKEASNPPASRPASRSARPVQDEDESKSWAAVEPFFGRPPDDPGVKAPAAPADDSKTRLKLF